ncbi:transmembrane protein 170A [Arctopsyche grandis]|uniref:transmembrane protein 170A n=1 Tax=Arctopsyche grandis TaxID=121162 RepID=UPI00406D903D
MYSMLSEFHTSELDTIADVISLSPADPLNTFAEMWYQVFLWSLFSSIFVHTCAALISFATLRKHKFGKFFPIFILLMGIAVPSTSGVLSSAAVAFVYRASELHMAPIYAMLWGIGQTATSACIGFTRILATL